VALLEVTELNQKPRLTSEDVGFTLAPDSTPPAAGQATLGVELLTTESPDRARRWPTIYISSTAAGRVLNAAFTWRPTSCQGTFDPKHDPALVLRHGWHAGVIGIVRAAGEKYHRPVVMIALDQVGSRPGLIRAQRGRLDLCQALAACSEHLMSFGGMRRPRAEDRRGESRRLPQRLCEHVAGRWLRPTGRRDPDRCGGAAEPVDAQDSGSN